LPTPPIARFSRIHPALRALCFLAFLSGLGCAPLEPVVSEVSVRANELGGNCPVSGENLTLSLTALGPFRAGPPQNVALYASGAPLAFPPETQGVDALLLQNGFRGYTERRTESGIDVLLWPERACALGDPANDGYPGPGGGQALGFSPELGAVLVAGEDDPSGQAQGGVVFDANTGVVEVLRPPAPTLKDTRAHATVTPVDGGFLIAGGEDPATGDASDAAFETRERWQSAYVYAPASGLLGDSIELQRDRTRHAALPLSEGAALLAGGYTRNGLEPQLEAVYPTHPVSSVFGLSRLEVGRLDPVLVRLDDGRILVGGGSLAIGAPVGTVEWFSADAAQWLVKLLLTPLPNRTFVALPGGGALTVASCETECGSDAEACACPRGLEASWITGDDPPRATPVELPETDACREAQAELVPLLVPGSDGAPWLIATSADTRPACLFRFNPWPADYGASTPGSAPRFEGPLEVPLDPPPDPRVTPLSLGPDSFVWVTAREPGGLHGARFGGRGVLSQDSPALGGVAAPAHLAPDRPVPVGDAAPPLYENSVLTLTTSSPTLTVWATDALYEDATVSLVIRAQGEGNRPPTLHFGKTLLGSAAPCSWPSLPASPAEGSVSLSAVRRGGQVTLRAGSASANCEVGPGALAVGLSAPAGGACSADAPCTSSVHDFRIDRD
jgi:hypothetical protein